MKTVAKKLFISLSVVVSAGLANSAYAACPTCTAAIDPGYSAGPCKSIIGLMPIFQTMETFCFTICGLALLLGLIFITLKLCKTINWKWAAVLIPAYIFPIFLVPGAILHTMINACTMHLYPGL